MCYYTFCTMRGNGNGNYTFFYEIRKFCLFRIRVPGSSLVRVLACHPGDPGSIPGVRGEFLVTFLKIPNFQGLPRPNRNCPQQFCIEISPFEPFRAFLFNKLGRRVPPSPLNLSMENCNFQVQKCQFFALFALLIITKTFTNQLCQLSRLVRTPRAQEIQKTKFIF